jgi:hypothetical protein
MPKRHWGPIVFAADEQRASLSRAVGAGTLRRVAPGIYTGDLLRPLEEVVDRNWSTIVAKYFPGAIFAGRSARVHRPIDGFLYVAHPRRTRPLVLPGLTVHPVKGPGPLPGDTELPDGLVLPSTARGLLDNLSRRSERQMPLEEVERWVADIVQDQGEERLNYIRDRAREIADIAGQHGALSRLDRIIAAALATGPAEAVVSEELRARAAGSPFDVRRADLFRRLAEYLVSVPPEPIPALPQDADRRHLLPFYEAYFSNYIEGTEFTLDEAASIALDGEIPTGRPADAHDIMGTYGLTVDDSEMARVPAGSESFLSILQERHRRVLAGRPEKRPGQWKRADNRAGSTVFVPWRLVEPTLVVGWDAGTQIIDPFSRAAYMVFIVSEVHPFEDGNGRIARLMMNAELVTAAQVRILIPTVFRNNYLQALRGASHNGQFQPLVSVLRFAQRYTARVDFSSRQAAERILERTNALRDPTEADAVGVRLEMP